MFLVAMIPPLWFSIMDKKVVSWAASDMDKVNVDPDLREKIYAKFHHPAEVSLTPDEPAVAA